MDLFKWIGWPFRSAPSPAVESAEHTAGPTREDFLVPRTRYQGEFTPANLAFDSNLQEFAQRVAYICSLETSGKISPDDAHSRIRELYEDLTRTHQGLGIGEE